MSRASASQFNVYADPSNLDALTVRFALTTGVSAQLVCETAGTGTDNIDIVLTPAGTGAFIRGPAPDGGGTGGGARGSRAVDLCQGHGDASRVALGTNSFVGSASSFMSAGATNSACLGGGSSGSSGTGSVALGGVLNGSSFDYTMSNGLYGGAFRYGEQSQAAGYFQIGTQDARTSTVVLRRQTANATPAILYLNGSSLRWGLYANSTVAFRIRVTGRRADADDESAAYEFLGCIDRNAATALVGSVIKTVIAEDTVGWDCDVTADAGNAAIAVTVTGGAYTVNWVARCDVVETIG